MKYIKADESLAEDIHKIVQITVKDVFPKYYPLEVVDFFCELHSENNIKNDILNGRVYALFDNDILIGTGSFDENHITRVYVLPEYQHKDFGTYIINELEKNIKMNYDTAVLDASLPAVMLYEKLGYKIIKHNKYELNNGAVLIYGIMKKELL